MRISQLAHATGVSSHRLRRWESAGLLHAKRTPAGYRDYPDECVREVTFISMGRDIGFSLRTLASVLPRYRAGTLPIEEMIELMNARITEVDAVIAEQKALRAQLVSHIVWFEERRSVHD